MPWLIISLHMIIKEWKGVNLGFKWDPSNYVHVTPICSFVKKRKSNREEIIIRRTEFKNGLGIWWIGTFVQNTLIQLTVTEKTGLKTDNERLRPSCSASWLQHRDNIASSILNTRMWTNTKALCRNQFVIIRWSHCFLMCNFDISNVK